MMEVNNPVLKGGASVREPIFTMVKVIRYAKLTER
jgi:hypothetical protein